MENIFVKLGPGVFINLDDVKMVLGDGESVNVYFCNDYISAVRFEGDQAKVLIGALDRETEYSFENFHEETIAKKKTKLLDEQLNKLGAGEKSSSSTSNFRVPDLSRYQVQPAANDLHGVDIEAPKKIARWRGADWAAFDPLNPGAVGSQRPRPDEPDAPPADAPERNPE